MRRARKIIGIVLAIPLAPVACVIVGEEIERHRATPPSSVTDIASFLEWRGEPADACRVSYEGEVYYHVVGPIVRILSSGPSGYSFDAHGKFIGWSPDTGDFKWPPEVFRPGAKHESITLDELRRIR